MIRTDPAIQLAAVYTVADAFFNPTVKDNYPTVNSKAETCGASVGAYSTVVAGGRCGVEIRS